MTFEEWMNDHNAAYPLGELGEFAQNVWKAAQAAEQKRIKSRVKDAAESLWCIRNQVGDEPYALYIGPSMTMMEQFVEKLMEK